MSVVNIRSAYVCALWSIFGLYMSVVFIWSVYHCGLYSISINLGSIYIMYMSVVYIWSVHACGLYLVCICLWLDPFDSLLRFHAQSNFVEGSQR
jgi:hypothetical protein